jgi:hypothetical protein
MNGETPGFRKIALPPIELLKEAHQILGDQYWLFVGICLVGLILGSIAPMAVLMGPMFCGMYLCYFKRMRDERVEFANLFDGFKHFVESLLATLVLVGIMLVVMIPVYIVMFVGMFATLAAAEKGGAGPPLALFGLMFGLYAVVLVLSILIGAFFMFAYPLIVDRGLKAMPAVTTSARAVWANFGSVMGMTFVNALLGFFAMLFCYLPVFLVLPLSFGATALAYRRVFPPPAGEEPLDALPAGPGGT